MDMLNDSVSPFSQARDDAPPHYRHAFSDDSNPPDHFRALLMSELPTADLLLCGRCNHARVHHRNGKGHCKICYGCSVGKHPSSYCQRFKR